MTWSVPTQPVPDATALEAFRTQVRETSTQFDTELQSKLQYAIGEIQENANIQYYQTTAVYRADHFPGQNSWYCWPHVAYHQDDNFYLPPSPLVSVQTLAYVDTEGNPQTLTEGADFEVITDEKPGYIRPVYGKRWPGARSVTVNYTIGFAMTWSEIPANQSEAALELGERYYRGNIPDHDDLRRIFAMASVGDELFQYL